MSEREYLSKFARLCAVEPELIPLLLDAMRDAPTTIQFIDSFRPRIIELAGYGARAQELRTRAAYDAVYDTIYSLVDDPPREAAHVQKQ